MSSCIAIACQDGTVQLVCFSCLVWNSDWKDYNWKDLHSTTVVVDGPLVCIQLSLRANTTATDGRPDHHNVLTALVGSLCGYVMCLTLKCCSSSSGLLLQQASSSSSSQLYDWKGPFLVAQGLWNSHMASEDLVLAVHLLDDYDDKGGNTTTTIAFGTHSGRCFLYRQQQQLGGEASTTSTTTTPLFQRIWHGRLPYSIHGICGWTTTSSVKGEEKEEDPQQRIRLVVTTRKSVHILDQQTTTRPTPKLDPLVARKRLDQLLLQVLRQTNNKNVQQQQQQQQGDNSNTRH